MLVFRVDQYRTPFSNNGKRYNGLLLPPCNHIQTCPTHLSPTDDLFTSDKNTEHRAHSAGCIHKSNPRPVFVGHPTHRKRVKLVSLRRRLTIERRIKTSLRGGAATRANILGKARNTVRMTPVLETSGEVTAGRRTGRQAPFDPLSIWPTRPHGIPDSGRRTPRPSLPSSTLRRLSSPFVAHVHASIHLVRDASKQNCSGTRASSLTPLTTTSSVISNRPFSRIHSRPRDAHIAVPGWRISST